MKLKSYFSLHTFSVLLLTVLGLMGAKSVQAADISEAAILPEDSLESEQESQFLVQDLVDPELNSEPIAPVETEFLPQDSGVEGAKEQEILDQIRIYNNEEIPLEQVTSVNQLSDIDPFWFEAVQKMVDKYGCIVGYPDGTFKGQRNITRYEFAAALSRCMEYFETNLPSFEGSDGNTYQRLVEEFATELAVLRGNVDAVEARLIDIEATQFSTTTKLFGQSVFGVQGRTENSFRQFNFPLEDQNTNINFISTTNLSLITQFDPRSLLLLGLVAGNGSTTSTPPALTNFTSLAYEGNTGNNNVVVSDLNFRHLLTDRLAVIFGPTAVNPVNVFRGVNRIESAGQGSISRFAQRNPIINIGSGSAGLGVDWQISDKFNLQAVYSASTGNNPNTGLFGGENGETSAGVQLGVSPTENIDLSLQYINAYSPFGRLGTGIGDDQLAILSPNVGTGLLRAPINTDAFGANVDWRINEKFTVGGWAGFTNSDFVSSSGSIETFNWMGYLNVYDLLNEGDLAGLYIGQPPKITSSDLPIGRNIPSFINEGNVFAGPGDQPGTTTHIELFYRWQVSDNISITPGAIYLIDPGHNSENDNIFIGAIRTTFSF